MSIQAGSGTDNASQAPDSSGAAGVVRRRFEVQGRVQGVGFRPFVSRLAADLGLGGIVGNDPRGAFIEVEGPVHQVQAFEARLRAELPPLAQIAGLSARTIPLEHERTFRIVTSMHDGKQDAEITPDVATCGDCLAELFDPQDRRYRYPFINCTNCGPRYSIIQAVPYDRPNTTMARFVMCPACQAEYDDPANRRFHAQPNACPVCGPYVWLTDLQGQEVSGDAIRVCAEWLRCGAVVAVKGLGGFHLACCADDDRAVARLRKRKWREAKPLAMMVPSLEAARELVEMDEASAAELTGIVRPIVLMPQRDETPISRLVAPNGDYFGIMLPYTPLHHLLFAEGLGPLVMTSANPAEEPLCCENGEARLRLAGIADAFLLHNREIERRVDDSVVMAMGSATASCRALPPVMPIRRARGYVPAPIPLQAEAPEPILAVGGELKATICLFSGCEAVLSEHLGELSNPAAYRNFVQTIERFKALLRAEPRLVAHDLHPDYVATRYARGLKLEATAVQHHHAHVVSCMADNGISGRVVGLSCDGTGYGLDGTIWGCEVLICDEADFERAGHLDCFPLLGGDAGARETWRPAAGLLHEAFGTHWREQAWFALRRVDEQAVAMADRRLAHPRRAPLTSSLGRLFDAAAFLLGVCDSNRYEAEAAMALEAVARQSPPVEPLAYRLVRTEDNGGPALLDVRPLIRDLVAGMKGGRNEAELARGFHETVAAMLADAADLAAERSERDRVVLSGGCFANRILLERLVALLQAAGKQVFVHQRVPPGDGGIALGQAVVAAERLRRRPECA